MGICDYCSSHRHTKRNRRDADMTTNHTPRYKLAAKTTTEAVQEIAEWGAHFGVLCSEGVWYAYDSRNIA